MTTPTPKPEPPKLVRITVDYVLDKVLDRLLPVVREEIQGLKADALKMIGDELPVLAATMSEAAIKEVFEHTQIDESIDKVTNVFDQILGRILPRR